MPTCPKCGKHAYAAIRECDNDFRVAQLYRCKGDDGRYYLHEIEWPQGVPDDVLTDNELSNKQTQHKS